MIWSLSYIYSTYLIPRPLGRSVQSCAHGIWRHGIGFWFHTLAIKPGKLQGSNSQLLFNSLGMSQYIYNFINIDYRLTKSTPEHAPPHPPPGQTPRHLNFWFLDCSSFKSLGYKAFKCPTMSKNGVIKCPCLGKKYSNGKCDCWIATFKMMAQKEEMRMVQGSAALDCDIDCLVSALCASCFQCVLVIVSMK